jgi:hypothetical protein
LLINAENIAAFNLAGIDRYQASFGKVGFAPAAAREPVPSLAGTTDARTGEGSPEKQVRPAAVSSWLQRCECLTYREALHTFWLADNHVGPKQKETG